MSAPACKLCKFWAQPERGGLKEDDAGECRRNAPQALLDPEPCDGAEPQHWTARAAAWPITLDTQFCGEFVTTERATWC